MSAELHRFLVFSHKTRRHHICVCAATSRRHALQIARQMFTLDRSAFAVPEDRNLALAL